MAEVALEAELTATRAQLTANEAVLDQGETGNWTGALPLEIWSPYVIYVEPGFLWISWKLWKLSPPKSS